MKKALSYLFAAILILSGIMHVINPEAYTAMIPSFIPEILANLFAAITEIAIGIMLLIPRYRRLGGIGFAFLMILFLPVHIWDLFREVPAIGSFGGAVIRLIIQFGLIWAGWWIWRDRNNK